MILKIDVIHDVESTDTALRMKNARMGFNGVGYNYVIYSNGAIEKHDNLSQDHPNYRDGLAILMRSNEVTEPQKFALRSLLQKLPPKDRKALSQPGSLEMELDRLHEESIIREEILSGLYNEQKRPRRNSDKSGGTA